MQILAVCIYTPLFTSVTCKFTQENNEAGDKIVSISLYCAPLSRWRDYERNSLSVLQNTCIMAYVW